MKSAPEAALALGTSAWSYEDWRGVFYPEKLAQSRLLAWYAEHFGAVEVDSTFYHSPSAKATARWAGETPPEFIFTTKLVRTITHERRLRESDELLAHYLKGLEPLGEKLGVVLVQLPPGFRPTSDGEALERFVERLPEGWRFAVEFRDRAWEVERYVACLAQHRVAWAWADTTPFEPDAGSDSPEAGKNGGPQWTPAGMPTPETAPFAYVRLLGDLSTKYDAGGKRRIERYDHIRWPRDAALAAWAARIAQALRGGMPVYCFAANHFEGCSPLTVERLARELGRPVSFPRPEAGSEGGQLGLF